MRAVSTSASSTDTARATPPIAVALVVVGAVALAAVVASDGSALGRLARAVLVAAGAAAAVVAIRRGSPRVRGFAELGSGLVGAGVGLGFAVPHVAKHDLTAAAVAASLVLVAGLALVVRGFVTVTRATRGRRRLGELAAMVVVTVVWLYASTIAVAATNVPRTELGSATPADVGLSYEDVTFSATDGVMLSGWYVPSHNGAAIVVAHGAGSTRSSVLAPARVLATHGFGVLLFDARGHGRSDGRAMDLGWYGDEDVSGAVTYLAGRSDVDPERVGALGFSMGGEEVIGAAASDPRIKAVVAEGATNRVAADRAWLSDAHGVRGLLHRGIDQVTYRLVDLLTAARPPASLRSSAARIAPRPVLLIAAGKIADEADAAAFIANGAHSNVEIWVAADAGHTGALDAQPAAWEQRVTNLFERGLKAGTR
jgi:uncharacterized protein